MESTRPNSSPRHPHGRGGSRLDAGSDATLGRAFNWEVIPAIFGCSQGCRAAGKSDFLMMTAGLDGAFGRPILALW